MVKKKEEDTADITKKCGIIMPIASHPEYPKEHWKEVLKILVEAINETEFEPRLVSDDVAIGLIHERIVNNIYNDDIVVCDVSSKNPNVMFELGMRLAFDKPTIIIKDEQTGYSFDTGVIEHLSYPSSLRFNNIVEFKLELIKKINGTYKKASTEENYSPFLKSFGKTIVPAKINQSEIAEGKYILSQLDNLAMEVKMLRLEHKTNYRNINYLGGNRKDLINDAVRKFIDTNKKLNHEDIVSNFIEIIKEEIIREMDFKPLNLEILQAVNEFYTSNDTGSSRNFDHIKPKHK